MHEAERKIESLVYQLAKSEEETDDALERGRNQQNKILCKNSSLFGSLSNTRSLTNPKNSILKVNLGENVVLREELEKRNAETILQASRMENLMAKLACLQANEELRVQERLCQDNLHAIIADLRREAHGSQDV